MKKKEMKKIALAVALAALGLAGVAQATPILVIVDSTNTQVPNAGPYPQAPTHAPFASGPQGQMSIGTDEAPPSFPDNIPTGTNGYGGQYLMLIDPSVSVGTLEAVNFTLLGHGDASFNNQFRVFGSQADLGTLTSPLINWTINGNSVGTSATVDLAVGELLPFLFTANSTSPSIGNNGTDNCAPDASGICGADFFLGDVNQVGDITQGTDLWIGFSDGGAEPADYDMQDMVISARVPEPASIFLVSAGLLGLAGLRRRKA